MADRILWVVESFDEKYGWLPCEAEWSRESGRRTLRDYKDFNLPNDRFRLKPYVPREGD